MLEREARKLAAEMIMKRAVLILCLLLVSLEAHAISRYNSTSMSCDDVRATIAGDGAAIMRYRSRRDPSLQLYGRYVRNRLFCKHDEIAERKYIPAADTRSCPVRECIQVDPDDDFPIFRLHRR